MTATLIYRRDGFSDKTSPPDRVYTNTQPYGCDVIAVDRPRPQCDVIGLSHRVYTERCRSARHAEVVEWCKGGINVRIVQSTFVSTQLSDRCVYTVDTAGSHVYVTAMSSNVCLSRFHCELSWTGRVVPYVYTH